MMQACASGLGVGPTCRPQAGKRSSVPFRAHGRSCRRAVLARAGGQEGEEDRGAPPAPASEAATARERKAANGGIGQALKVRLLMQLGVMRLRLQQSNLTCLMAPATMQARLHCPFLPLAPPGLASLPCLPPEFKLGPRRLVLLLYLEGSYNAGQPHR